ncbi:S-adenosyl-L-methionine-dependent methyltransferase [Mycena sanguinolenta]|nr:S-adenosyl-L-methionine-dependent methyltransferase [Mycena sanguinolenta]
MTDSQLKAKSEAQETYHLPTDTKEQERLSLQDQVWRSSFGGLNPAELHDAINARMAVRDGPPPAVLDVGCGTGSWAIEMGTLYPQAQILGVDLVIKPDLHAPSNVQFKQLDITQGVPSTDGGYDIIHARVVTGHLKDPIAFVQAAYAQLAPGGLMIIADVFKPLWGDKRAAYRLLVVWMGRLLVPDNLRALPHRGLVDKRTIWAVSYVSATLPCADTPVQRR